MKPFATPSCPPMKSYISLGLGTSLHLDLISTHLIGITPLPTVPPVLTPWGPLWQLQPKPAPSAPNSLRSSARPPSALASTGSPADIWMHSSVPCVPTLTPNADLNTYMALKWARPLHPAPASIAQLRVVLIPHVDNPSSLLHSLLASHGVPSTSLTHLPNSLSKAGN